MKRSILKISLIVIILTVLNIDKTKANPNIKENPKRISEKSDQGSEQGRAFDIDLFMRNPYLVEDKLIPSRVANNYDEIISSLPPIIKEEIVKTRNEHNESIVDKKHYITTENYYLCYYYATTKDVYYLNFFQINSGDSEFKYNIKFGMTIDQIVNIVGKQNEIYKHKSNIEYAYFGREYGQVNFSFENGELSAINIWLTD